MRYIIVINEDTPFKKYVFAQKINLIFTEDSRESLKMTIDETLDASKKLMEMGISHSITQVKDNY